MQYLDLVLPIVGSFSLLAAFACIYAYRRPISSLKRNALSDEDSAASPSSPIQFRTVASRVSTLLSPRPLLSAHAASSRLRNDYVYIRTKPTLSLPIRAIPQGPSTQLCDRVRPGCQVLSLFSFYPSLPDEMQLNFADKIQIETIYTDGWALGKVFSTNRRGIFPLALTYRHPLMKTRAYADSVLHGPDCCMGNSCKCLHRPVDQQMLVKRLSHALAASPHWSTATKRIGALAVKVGSSALWSDSGDRIHCTVLQLQDTEVVSHRLRPYLAVQVGCVSRLPKNVNHALLGHFAKNAVQPKLETTEFRVDSEAALVPVGSVLKASHFVPGQFIDLQGKTIGKGYAGVMKRHGFKGLRASHGVSISHRSGGSTGQHQDPGRVFPGKKMAGRMGGKRATCQSLLCLRVDNVANLVYVKGSVPGHVGSVLKLTDALRKRSSTQHGLSSLPFPAATASQSLPSEVILEQS